jgi:hypothetical protein
MAARKIAAAALAILMVAVSASGCGGSDSDGENGGPNEVAETAIKKAQYVKRGDAICENVPNRYRVRLQKLPQKQQENPKQSAPKAAVPPLWTAAEELAALGAPDGDEAKAQAMVEALENAARALEENPERELSGPQSGLAEFNRLAQRYGFEFCAQL